jgi:hypothetical protein
MPVQPRADGRACQRRRRSGPPRGPPARAFSRRLRRPSPGTQAPSLSTSLRAAYSPPAASSSGSSPRRAPRCAPRSSRRECGVRRSCFRIRACRWERSVHAPATSDPANSRRLFGAGTASRRPNGGGRPSLGVIDFRDHRPRSRRQRPRRSRSKTPGGHGLRALTRSSRVGLLGESRRGDSNPGPPPYHAVPVRYVRSCWTTPGHDPPANCQRVGVWVVWVVSCLGAADVSCAYLEGPGPPPTRGIR